MLLGGVPGVRPARVVIIGAGHVGWNAAWIAQGMEAEVLLLDRDIDRLRWVDQIHQGRIMTLASSRAVDRARHLRGRSRDRRRACRRRPGSGRHHRGDGRGHESRERSSSTSPSTKAGASRRRTRPPTRTPTYFVPRRAPLRVGNMPAVVPHTSTYALTNATFPYLVELAEQGCEGGAVADPVLRRRCQHACTAAARTRRSHRLSASTGSIP